MAKPGQQNQQTPSYEKTTCTRRGLVKFHFKIRHQSEQQYLDHCPWADRKGLGGGYIPVDVNTFFDVNFVNFPSKPEGIYSTTESVDTRTFSNISLSQGTFNALDEINEDGVRFSPVMLEEVERIAHDEVLPVLYNTHPYLSADGSKEYVENHCTVEFFSFDPKPTEITNLNIGYGTQSINVDCFNDDAGKSVKGWYTFNPDCEAIVGDRAFQEVGTIGGAGLLGPLKDHTLGNSSFKSANINTNLTIKDCDVNNAVSCFENARIQGNITVVGAKGGSSRIPDFFAKDAEGVNFIKIDLPFAGNVGEEAFFRCSAKSLGLWRDCVDIGPYAFAGNVFESRVSELSANTYDTGCFQTSFITRLLFDLTETDVRFHEGCFANNDIGKGWAEDTPDSTVTLPQTSYILNNAFYNACYLDSSNRVTLNLNNVNNGAIVGDGAFAYNRYSKINMDSSDIYSFGDYSFAFWHGLRKGQKFHVGSNTEIIGRGVFRDWGEERTRVEGDNFYNGWQKYPDTQNTPDITSLCLASKYRNFRAFDMPPSWDVLGYKARVFDDSVTNEEFYLWYTGRKAGMNGRDNNGYWDQQSFYEMEDGTKIYGGDGYSLRSTYSRDEALWIASTQTNWRGITYETDAPSQIVINHPGYLGGNDVTVDKLETKYPAALGSENVVETYSYITGDLGENYPEMNDGYDFYYNSYDFELFYEPWTPNGTWDSLYSRGIVSDRYKSGWVMRVSNQIWIPQWEIFLQNGDPLNPVGQYLEVQLQSDGITEFTIPSQVSVTSASAIKPSNDQASVILGDRNGSWNDPRTNPTLTCTASESGNYNSRSFREKQGFWGIVEVQ